MSEDKKTQREKIGGRQVTISIPDKTYMDLLIKIRHENLNWRRFFSILIKGFLDDHNGLMECIDSEMSLIRAKNRTKVLKKERKDTEETIRKFGLDKEEIENIYDILEEEIEP